MPLPKRRSSNSSSFRRTLLGRDCLPPPTAMGATNSWHSSTKPALNAWAAKSGPPTVMSRPAAAFICRTASGSKARSMRVLPLDTVSSVLENTILSAARQISANSRMKAGWSARSIVSQATITS
jgi:hypothetical protein